MERLEQKKIHGQTYFYYSKWEWINGKCRRVWQKYLGKPADIAMAVQGTGPPPLYAEVFQWGLPTALLTECTRAMVVAETNALCPKRDQGLSTGDYLAIAAINRAIYPKSKRSMWEWFSKTVLLRHLPNASKPALASQRFFDHMDRIDAPLALSIWKNILRGVVQREGIDLSCVSYDGTNFYTFIDTFNVRCTIARRGKNKQGSNNLRQISYALFCCADGHMPLYYDVYEGNRNDAKQFPFMLQRFHYFIKDIYGKDCPVPNTTIIFDKGNNSKENFGLIDSLELDFVGSVKLDEHKDLASVSNKDARFVPCCSEALARAKAFRVKKEVYGKERVLVVTYNQKLFGAQWLTLQNDMVKAVEKLSALRQKLEDRANGSVTRGKAPTEESVVRQCQEILGRQYVNRIIKTTITKGKKGFLQLAYEIENGAVDEICDTYLGKNIIITSREAWDDERIILAYRSQFIIEDVFKEMKDRHTGSWWPLHHYTDSKVMVHGLYCSLALLLRALAYRRVRKAGLPLSMKRFLSELDAIREVVNIYPRKRREKNERKQSVLTKFSEVQERILAILELKWDENAVLG